MWRLIYIQNQIGPEYHFYVICDDPLMTQLIREQMLPLTYPSTHKLQGIVAVTEETLSSSVYHKGIIYDMDIQHGCLVVHVVFQAMERPLPFNEQNHNAIIALARNESNSLYTIEAIFEVQLNQSSSANQQQRNREIMVFNQLEISSTRQDNNFYNMEVILPKKRRSYFYYVKPVEEIQQQEIFLSVSSIITAGTNAAEFDMQLESDMQLIYDDSSINLPSKF